MSNFAAIVLRMHRWPCHWIISVCKQAAQTHGTLRGTHFRLHLDALCITWDNALCITWNYLLCWLFWQFDSHFFATIHHICEAAKTCLAKNCLMVYSACAFVPWNVQFTCPTLCNQNNIIIWGHDPKVLTPQMDLCVALISSDETWHGSDRVGLFLDGILFARFPAESKFHRTTTISSIKKTTIFVHMVTRKNLCFYGTMSSCNSVNVLLCP